MNIDISIGSKLIIWQSNSLNTDCVPATNTKIELLDTVRFENRLNISNIFKASLFAVKFFDNNGTGTDHTSLAVKEQF